jgi:hypothetical protein
MTTLPLNLFLVSALCVVCLWNAAVFRQRWEANRVTFWRSLDFALMAFSSVASVFFAHGLFRLYSGLAIASASLASLCGLLLVCAVFVGYVLHTESEPVAVRATRTRKATG